MSALPRNWFSWPRLVAIVVSGTLLFVVFRQLDFATLWTALAHAKLWPLAITFAVYWFTLCLGIFVWHVALKAVGHSTHFLATDRFALIGHFFFTTLFGAVGCDLAKSAVYARWYKFGMAEVLAAAPLERCLRGTGAAFLGLLVVAAGGMAAFSSWELKVSAFSVIPVAILIAIVGAAVARRHPVKGQGFISRLRRALRTGVAGLVRSPKLSLGGICAAVFAQAGASLVFALCLLAVTKAHLPWARLAWTFPTIVIVSCIPFTVAGTGVREVAAVALLGIYGVTSAEAVACSLLSLAQKLLLAALGALAWWREEALQKRAATRVVPATISVVIPTLNEAADLPQTLQCARAVAEVSEIIVVDGGSTDGTVAIAERSGCRVLKTRSSRGGQMRLGGQNATEDVVVFLHADTWLGPNAGQAVLNCLRDGTVVGGGFWKKYRQASLPLLGSRVKCLFRLLVSRKVYGDQGIFVRRDALEQIGGVPDVPLMEEFDLCRALRRVGRLALADATVQASARRFQKHGYLKTTWLTWRVSMLRRMGKSTAELAAIYDGAQSAEPPAAPEPVVAPKL